MTRHECPDCGHVHELKAEERIRRLEKRVRELEAMRGRYEPYFRPYYRWIPNIANSYRAGSITYSGSNSTLALS